LSGLAVEWVKKLDFCENDQMCGFDCYETGPRRRDWQGEKRWMGGDDIVFIFGGRCGKVTGSDNF